jgi:cellulose synthase/poly-beta-1,6-N-acetylglucosamine synthase-like glycosyltransferase
MITPGYLVFLAFRDVSILLGIALLAKYFVYLCAAAYYPLREQRRRLRTLQQEIAVYGEPQKYEPLVTVIVPAWNEEVGVITTVESVLTNDYHNIEIVVINDGSTDNSERIVNEFIHAQRLERKRNGRVIRQFYQENGGKGKALNLGIRKSTGAIVLTMDADSVLAPDAISKLVSYFRDPSVSVVFGQIRVGNSHGRIIGIAQQLEYTLFRFYSKRAHCVMGAEYMYDGACTAFRRAYTFNYFGVFDEKNKTEDIEMSMRTKYHGMRSIYAEDVICYTEAAANYKGLMNQRLRWKKGRLDTFLHYRRIFFSFDKQHNKFLSWFVLPLALIAEVQLLLEPIAIAILVTYCVVTGQFMSLALSMAAVGVWYVVVALFSSHLSRWERVRLVLMWPMTWPLLYVIDWIEFHALLRGMFMVLRDDTVEWQTWQREGI